MDDADFVCPHGLKADVNIRTGRVIRRRTLDDSFKTWTPRKQGAADKTGNEGTLTGIHALIGNSGPRSPDDFDSFSMPETSPVSQEAHTQSLLSSTFSVLNPKNLRTALRRSAGAMRVIVTLTQSKR